MAAASIITSVITGGSNSHQTTSEELNAVASDFVIQGVVGAITSGSPGTGSFAVTADASPDMGVTVLSGWAYVSGVPSGQNTQVLRARMTSNYTTYTINANSSGSTKYDWIYLSLNTTNAATPSSTADNVITLYTSRSSSNSADNGSPPTYGLLLAVVTVANGASSITNGNISDKRITATIGASTNSQATGWNTNILPVPNTVVYNGNRSYTLTYNSLDLTGTLCPGLRIRTTRATGAPTQSTSLNGTTQYWSKTSPAGMPFTDNFTVSAWVKLTSYGAQGGIMSRYNGTSGWLFIVTATGQLRIEGINGSAVTRAFDTYPSIPLNKWVHVAATLNMAGGTATTYIDGVAVPNFSSGGAATALVQAGNLEVGTYNATAFFPGKIAQAAVFSTVLSQATIQSYYSQGLLGTETSLISAYSFNGNANDLNSTNANNLTANGAATATATDSPFGGQAGGTISSTLDYGIVQSATFSTNTTVVVQVAEGCTIATSGGISAVAYSSVKAPYGMPVQKGKWGIESQIKVLPTGATGTGTWTQTGSNLQLTVPVGEWILTSYLNFQINGSSTATVQVLSSISTSNSAESDSRFTGYLETGNTAVALSGNSTKANDVSVTTSTPYYAIAKALTGGGTVTTYIRGDNGASIIRAENALL